MPILLLLVLGLASLSAKANEELATPLRCSFKANTGITWLVSCDVRRCVVIKKDTKEPHPAQAKIDEHVKFVSGVPDDCEEVTVMIQSIH